MTYDEMIDRGLVVLGCGKMGSALLAGWLDRGIPPGKICVIEPRPSDWLAGIDGLSLNDDLPEAPGIVLIAVKPQQIGDALPALAGYGGGSTLVLSIAAGVNLATYESMFGAATPVVRAMPNTPAAIGQGISAIVGNGAAEPPFLAAAESLLSAVGEVVRLTDEAQMDAVTAVSGSGPAYVFLMIEAMTEAGVAEGLEEALALALARATVAGAGALAAKGETPPGDLRRNVTSPGGTTAAALDVLLDESQGLRPLLRRAVQAAKRRSQELGR